jgi:alkylhydroperoxidase family enzyme
LAVAGQTLFVDGGASLGTGCSCHSQHTPVPDKKLNALVTLVKELVRERGYAKDETIENFIAPGYQREQVIEFLLGIALKTISNYLDHISPAPVDQAFAAESK